MKKFELTSETKINIFGKKLFRIKALISFGVVKTGETGGWVEKEENVNQSGNAWVNRVCWNCMELIPISKKDRVYSYWFQVER
jgi:hypothetical protein